MNITPTEAEEALDAIQSTMNKTRRAISSSGSHAFLILWGFIWLSGFMSSHFLPGETAGHVWMWLDILGGVLSVVVGARMNRSVRSPALTATGKRIGWFWLLLFFYCAAAIGVAWPLDYMKIAMLITIFAMIGWMAMGLLLSFPSMIKWGLAITALALIGYFLLPDYFYLWMAILGGGGMIALGLAIRYRW